MTMTIRVRKDGPSPLAQEQSTVQNLRAYSIGCFDPS